jgi:SMP-30/Gluconolactonase/LRE-like region
MMTTIRGGLAAAALALLAACGGGNADARADVVTVSGMGLQDPESVLHDSVADVYLVSNVYGMPIDRDGNGFISRIQPDGREGVARWIGIRPGTLNAPKGMGIVGDTLYVADIDVVRRFHRATGAPLGEVPIPGATFLNDVAVGPDGSVYVTDSGLRMGAGRLQASGTDAVHRILPGGRVQTVVRGAELGSPNGIVVDADGGLIVAGMSSGEVYRVGADGGRTLLRAPSRGQLDGLVRTRGGSLLVSEWKRSSVYRIHADAEPEIALRNLPSPADIGYDARRNRLLVPLMTVNRLELHPAP